VLQSLAVRFSLLAGLLVGASVGLVAVVSYRRTTEAARAEVESGARALVESLAVSHAAHVLGGAPTDRAELSRVAQRLAASAFEVDAVLFVDATGTVLAEAGSGSKASDLSGDQRPRSRHEAPVVFGGREVGWVRVSRLDRFATEVEPALRRDHMLFGLLASLGSALLVWLLAREYLRPIPDLTRALDRLRDGDFAVRVESHGEHELARLAAAFNEMSQRLALFGQYTNPAIIRAIQRDPDLAGPRGTLRHVTVVFCDMRGFTRMSSQREPGEVLRQVNLYFHLLERVVLEHGGHVDKFMGDAMMAVFGLFDMPLHDLQSRLARNEPVPYSRQAVRAMVRARDAVRLLNRFLRETSPASLPSGLSPQVFGCGIASGYVTAGNIGGERKKDYTVIGSVVNLAARLESRSEQGEVLVDRHTRRNLGEYARCEARPPVELKGFDQPIALSEVVALDDDDFRSWAPALFDEKFVERALLQEDPLFDTGLVRRHTEALRRLIAEFDPEPTRPG